MRIALRHTGDAGQRCGRILLGEASLDSLGLLDSDRIERGDRRVVTVDDLDAYDVLVTDAGPDLTEDVESALDAGISCVVWEDSDDLATTYGDAFRSAGATLMIGANLAAGIAPCLAAHETVGAGEVLDTVWAWTEPGRPFRRGVPLTFPDPVGPSWGREEPPAGPVRRYVARTEPPWAGAIARVTTGTADGVVTRTVGVADLDAHLEAIALTAGALAYGGYGYGPVSPSERASDYMAAALRVGLGVAVHEAAS